ncbi:hypothetical protein PINS_up004432 [Pythium insidiosum]|nr:hypothetical protein PINS_up004432 [Pythium insidiosum]
MRRSFTLLMLLTASAAVVLFTLRLMLQGLVDSKPWELRRALRWMKATSPQQSAAACRLAAISIESVTIKRGIVLPLFDPIAALGVSLLAQLSAQGVDLPVEIPHCGDLDPKWRALLSQHRSMWDPNPTRLQPVRVYDVCEAAVRLNSDGYVVFCRSIHDCHNRFRGFDIKILALLLSRFDEIMLVDADTLFFSSPMALWSTEKYQETGTLFFHDRVSFERAYLDESVTLDGRPASELQRFLHTFDIQPFQSIRTLPRSPAPPQLIAQLNVSLPFQPSPFLLQSHSWNRRAGHQLDSSLLLWHKSRQARATAILASFITLGADDVHRPPSYGDKELYFVACELAETAYAFSDFGVGAIGTDARDGSSSSSGHSVLCGDALHFVPGDDHEDVRPLYINSDAFLTWNTTSSFRALFRTRARPAADYGGSFATRSLPHVCPFDVSVAPLSESEQVTIRQRQELFAAAVSLESDSHTTR